MGYRTLFLFYFKSIPYQIENLTFMLEISLVKKVQVNELDMMARIKLSNPFKTRPTLVIDLHKVKDFSKKFQRFIILQSLMPKTTLRYESSIHWRITEFLQKKKEGAKLCQAKSAEYKLFGPNEAISWLVCIVELLNGWFNG